MPANGDSPDDHSDRATAPELPASADEDEALKRYADLAMRMHQAALQRDEADKRRDRERLLYEANMDKRMASLETGYSDLRADVQEIRKLLEGGKGQ